MLKREFNPLKLAAAQVTESDELEYLTMTLVKSQWGIYTWANAASLDNKGWMERKSNL